ncbi:unnamed protein product, partial [Ixodes persulcatus]
YRLPRRSDRPTAAVILRLRTGCPTTPVRLHRFHRHVTRTVRPAGCPPSRLTYSSTASGVRALGAAVHHSAAHLTAGGTHICREEAVRALIGYLMDTGLLQLL